MNVSKRMMGAAAVLAILVIAAGLSWIYFGDLKASNDPLITFGNVDVRQVNLAFKVAGRIATVNLEEGDSIKAGEIVASLEKADVEDGVHLARARVKGQEAVLAELQTGTRPEIIQQARALVTERQAALRLAEATLKRQEVLAGRDFASHQVHEEAQARLEEAGAQLQAAQEALKLAEIGPREEEIEKARAQLSAHRAELSLAERRLADTSLKAPNDGIILTRVREVGAIVGVGETVYTLSLTTPVWVRTYVGEPDLGRIHAGMRAEIRTDSGGTYQGQIGFISSVAEFTPKTVETNQLRTSLVYRLRVIVKNPDNGLRQGMPVTVIMHTNDKS